MRIQLKNLTMQAQVLRTRATPETKLKKFMQARVSQTRATPEH
jgi:hypothetical protein